MDFCAKVTSDYQRYSEITVNEKVVLTGYGNTI